MSSPHRLRILSLEDDAHDAELIQELLEAEGIACQLFRVDSQGAFSASLEQGEIDLILADYTLPGFRWPIGLEAGDDFAPGSAIHFCYGYPGRRSGH